MARKSSSRKGGGIKPSPFSIVKIWPVVVIGLLIFAAVFAVKAYKSNNVATDEQNSVQATIGLKHYPNLEIARKADGSNGKSIRKDYTGFTVMFNPDNGTPDWVGWELLATEASGDISRSNKFWQDYDLKGCPSSDDYKGSGYDRGHLCPAGDQKWSEQAMTDCFVMANMTPQDHALNAGAWQTLEKKERLWAERDSVLVIVAGPIYADGDTKRIGESKVRVPSSFFKVILAPYVEKPRAIGFIYPNMTAPGNMANYAMSVDDVEAYTGLDFFSTLPDEIENEVEKHFSFTLWNKQ